MKQNKANIGITGEPICCYNCIFSDPIPFKDDYSCKHKGVVHKDYVCSKHVLNITLAANVRKHLGNIKKEAENMEI